MMDKVDVIAIAGAGVTGLSLAYVLMQRGYRIDLYDPAGFPAQSASSMAGGMLAPYSEIEHMPPAWIEAGLAGIAFWKTCANTKNDFDFKQNGSLLLAHTPDRYILERFKTHLPSGSTITINAQRLSSLEPDLARGFDGSVLLEQEAHLHPQKALAHLLNAVQKSKNNRFRFITEKSDITALTDTYPYVMDCRGMGAQKSEPGLRGVKGEFIIVQNPEFSLSRPVRLMHPRYPLYIVPRTDHIFMIGATNIESSHNQKTSVRSAMELLSAAYSLHPSFGEAEILDIGAGIRPSYSDNLPRITRVRKQTSYIMRCNGLYRHGFLLAPVIASCVADMLDAQENPFIPLLTGGSDEICDQRRRANMRSAA